MTDIFIDSADLDKIKYYSTKKQIKGFTTNPSIMEKFQITDYAGFIEQCLKICSKKEISFEVFGSNIEELKGQCLKLKKFGKNIFIKIPAVNEFGKENIELIQYAINNECNINITALMSSITVNSIFSKISFNSKSNIILSIFAGRIADTGRDPEEQIKLIQMFTQDELKMKNIKILWASPRESFNIIQAQNCKCDIITVTPEIYEKFSSLYKKDLQVFEKETVQMFEQAARKLIL